MAAQSGARPADPARLHDLACVIHLHSTYSDGTPTVPQIIGIASKAERDVVLLTDHDTLAARDAGWEGWHGGVLLGVGVEVSPRDGHFLAFGVDREIEHQGMEEAEIPRAVARAGGFGFAAHPFSRGARILERYGFATRRGRPHGWTALEDEALTGVELWSLTTDAAEAWRGPVDAIAYLRDPEGHLDGPPAHHLEAWDRLCTKRRVVAIGGLDAHQNGIRVRGRLITPMWNERYFRMLPTYVSVPEPPSGDSRADLDLVYGALREGLCFLSVDAFAPGRGFRFWAEADSDVALMGEERAAGRWTLRATVPRRAKLVLVRNGSSVATVDGDRLEHSTAEPGVYRIEARLDWRGRERPWILSNPIYLR